MENIIFIYLKKDIVRLGYVNVVYMVSFASIPSKMDTSDNNVFPKSEMYECINQTSGIRGTLSERWRKTGHPWPGTYISEKYINRITLGCR